MSNYSLEDLTVGNFDPKECFKFVEEVNIKETFDYPFREFCDVGCWDINGKPTMQCTESEIALAKNLLQLKLDEAYYIQEGCNDAQSWFILGKVGNLYVYFEAACDYTGFSCRGAGTFGYSENWKTLWNMHTTASFRSLVLAYYGLDSIKINYEGRGNYNDSEYIKKKLKTLNKSAAC